MVSRVRGEQSQNPWFNKHSLITRHRGTNKRGVGGGRDEKPAAGAGAGAGGRRAGVGSWILSAHLPLSQPLSRLLGQGRDPATNHCNGLYMLPWGLPVCQGIAPTRGRRLIKLQKSKSEGAGEARGWRSLGEGGRALSASHQPGAGDGMAHWLVTLIGFPHCCIPRMPAPGKL